jgi:hypothetical protein
VCAWGKRRREERLRLRTGTVRRWARGGEKRWAAGREVAGLWEIGTGGDNWARIKERAAQVEVRVFCFLFIKTFESKIFSVLNSKQRRVRDFKIVSKYLFFHNQNKTHYNQKLLCWKILVIK